MGNSTLKADAREFVDQLWALVDQAKADGDFSRARELEGEAREAELQLATQIGLAY